MFNPHYTRILPAHLIQAVASFCVKLWLREGRGIKAERKLAPHVKRFGMFHLHEEVDSNIVDMCSVDCGILSAIFPYRCVSKQQPEERNCVNL